MSSAKQGYPTSTVLERVQPASGQPAEQFFSQLNNQLRATIHTVERLTRILSVVVHAPMAAEHFQPGQFYRFRIFQHPPIIKILDWQWKDLPDRRFGGY